MFTTRNLVIFAFLALSACASQPERTSGPTPVEQSAGSSPSKTAEPPSRFDARLSEYDYPFDVKVFALEAQQQSLEIAYMDEAPAPDAANGRTVLLLHGKNFSGAYWSRTIDALVRDGFRVIAPDQVGFGKSSKPAHFQFTFHALATHTATLLDHLGVDSVSVVGHSMGGMLATRFALMFPARTEKLALVNPIGLEDWKRVVPYLSVDEWYGKELKKTPEGVREYMKASYFDGTWKPEYDAIADIQMGWAESADREILSWVSALTYDMIFTQPVLYEFKDLTVPTLLIIGQRDRTALGKNLVDPSVASQLGRYPELGRAAHAAIPQSQLLELEGIGHIPQFEDWPRYIAALQSFLNEPGAR